KMFPPALAALLVASVFLYAFGLVLNDLMDLREDRVARPKRPLPSGAVKTTHAALAAAGLALAALAICACLGLRVLVFGGAIFLAVTAYNTAVKHIPVAGSLNMGACRGLNVLLGASLAPAFTPLSFTAAAVITAYITGVTLLARNETQNPRIPPLIGKLIRALILIQAIFCALAGGVAGWVCAAILVLALWPLSRIVGKKFYGS
ncbi:MAG TPA: UbiA family prenyltransferase, partial [Chthoniobacteraceae bacterium]|nr:UbiA family prenyltransferase [Chthoniobacteraceae bacterium]